MTTTSKTYTEGVDGPSCLTEDGGKIVVSYARKINNGNYESTDLFCSVAEPVHIDATEDEKLAIINGAFLLAKTTVFEQAGLGIAVDATGKAREALEKTFGEVTTETVAPARAAARPQPAGSPAAGLTGQAAKQALWEDLASNPQDWYDNRVGKKNAKAPDFKRVATPDDALWSTYNNKSVVPQGIVIPDGGFKNS